jgi:hypothetical protein
MTDDVGCSIPRSIGLLYELRAELGQRRAVIDRLTSEADPVVLIIAAAAREHLEAEERTCERAMGSAWLANRLQDLQWASRLAARPGSLEQPHLQARAKGAV